LNYKKDPKRYMLQDKNSYSYLMIALRFCWSGDQQWREEVFVLKMVSLKIINFFFSANVFLHSGFQSIAGAFIGLVTNEFDSIN